MLFSIFTNLGFKVIITAVLTSIIFAFVSPMEEEVPRDE